LTGHSASGVLTVYLGPLIVLIAAVAVAGFTYAHFLETHRSLWIGVVHDRHAHYLLGQSMALDIRHGDVGQLLRDFDSARIWPPLHGFLVAAVLTITGPDYRFAVLPSLAAYVGTVLLGFLVARRVAPRGGNLAGLVAAVFLLASPAHRAFATDVMLESLGACMTLLVLYVYLVHVQQASRWSGAALGLSLTLLFITKYNYWALIVVALVVTEIAGGPGAAWTWLRGALGGFDWRGQLRRPFNYVTAALLALAVWVMATGGTTFHVAGNTVSLTMPHNLISLAYLMVFLRAAIPWRRHGRDWLASLAPRYRPLVAWHIWPVAVWFLWPKKLGSFLWYLGPGGRGECPCYDRLSGFPYYARCLATDYHTAVWLTVLAAGLLFAALLWRRGLRPGGAVVLWLVLLSALIAAEHPNRKSRVLHSWIAATWVAAGVGVAGLVHGRLTARHPRVQPWLAGAAVGGLGLACLPGLLEPAHAAEGGPQPQYLSSLDLTDSYLSCLKEARQVAILSNVPMKFLTQWTFMDRYDAASRPITDWKGSAGPVADAGERFSAWLAATPCDTIVYLDMLPNSPYCEIQSDPQVIAQVREALAAQQRFPLVGMQYLQSQQAIVMVWSCNPALAHIHLETGQ
jgi:hypothetical protein